VDGEDHGAGGISDGGIRVGARIIEELGDIGQCFGCGFGLRSSERAQGDRHGAFYRTGLVQERANDLLEAFNLVCR
jgi:hypothetical protein